MTLAALAAGALVFADGGTLELPPGVGAKSEPGVGVRLMKWVRPPGKRHPVLRERVLPAGASRDEVDAALAAIQEKG